MLASGLIKAKSVSQAASLFVPLLTVRSKSFCPLIILSSSSSPLVVAPSPLQLYGNDLPPRGIEASDPRTSNRANQRVPPPSGEGQREGNRDTGTHMSSIWQRHDHRGRPRLEHGLQRSIFHGSLNRQRRARLICSKV